MHITGEASVDAAFDNTRWKEYPGNENCMEPRITNADYLHKLFPKLKVVFVVRNPVDRYVIKSGGRPPIIVRNTL